MAVSIINALQLHEKMNSGKPIFILDVRNSDEYQDWKIEGTNVESINIPYFDFLEDNENNYKDLPADKEIIVICAKGGGSLMVAEMLDEKGYKVSNLEKGMVEWSQFYAPETVVLADNMKLIQVNRLAKGCLSYMVISDGKALIVDPGRHTEEYLRIAEQENATIETIMDTHCHADHISGGPELAAKTGAAYYIASGEMQDSEIPYEPLEKHEYVEVGAVNVKILAMPTPGHTPGSTSFLVNDQYLLSGDTIFVGGLGRPDLGGKAREWAQSLYETVMTTISDLSDDILVLPSHFADVEEINANGFVGAMLGEIRSNNDIMRTEDREQFTERVVAGSEYATPPNYEQIIGINRGVVDVSTEEATELEIGPNRCAVHHSH
jgi:glyoxylase-like metal-dependent hydrolase (beta-lactamase superfamily II)